MNRIDLNSTSPSALKCIHVLASVGSLQIALKNFKYSSFSTSSLSRDQIATLLLIRCQSQTSTFSALVSFGFSSSTSNSFSSFGLSSSSFSSSSSSFSTTSCV
jgi:hypothetical protein